MLAGIADSLLNYRQRHLVINKLSTGISPLDSPPFALRWSIVMQRKSFLNSSIALNTWVGQSLIREFKPPPGVTRSGKPDPASS